MNYDELLTIEIESLGVEINQPRRKWYDIETRVEDEDAAIRTGVLMVLARLGSEKENIQFSKSGMKLGAEQTTTIQSTPELSSLGVGRPS